VTVAEAVGAVGAHAGNASPEANIATDGAGLGLAPGLGGVAVPEVVEAGAVAAPGSVDEEGAGVVHADSVMRTATSAAAMGLCKVPLPGFAAKVEIERSRRAECAPQSSFDRLGRRRDASLR
jgi:hypothetical protein